jgi:dolichol-phosphate mannosyltransferase
MLRFAFDAITGFSVMPLKISIHLGAAVGMVALVSTAYVLLAWIRGETVAGWASLMVVVLLLGSVHLFVLGIIGEYLGQIFLESKRRPLFVIQDICRGPEK